MRKYKVDYNWWMQIDRRPNLYAAESEYANIIYVFAKDEVAIVWGRDVWRMDYEEAEALADSCLYPPIKKEMYGLLDDVKWQMQRGSVMFSD